MHKEDRICHVSHLSLMAPSQALIFNEAHHSPLLCLSPHHHNVPLCTFLIQPITECSIMSQGQDKIVCENCDKKTQKELPASSSDQMSCHEAYAAVSKCMKKNNGQISPCVKEWDEFKTCHEKCHVAPK